MVMSCAAYGCTNRFKKGCGVSFHGFPSNPLMLKRWVIAMKRQNFSPNKYSKLCSEHFVNDDFVYNFGQKKLRQDAIPTLFAFPERLRKPRPLERSKRLKIQEEKFSDQLEICDTSTCVPNVDNARLSNESNNITNYSEQNTGNTLIQPVALCQPIKKRKRNNPVYMGDVTSEHLKDPENFIRIWKIAQQTINRQKKTLMYLRTKMKRLQKKLNTLNDLISHLKENNKISSNCYALLQECIPTAEKQILLRQLKLTTEKKFPPELRAFAVTLHFYSSAAYAYVRKVFGNCLPHQNTVRRWYSSIDGSPGYTVESLNAIKVKAEEFRKKEEILICALMKDDMSIREYVGWDGSKNVGYINFGFNIDNDSLPLAKQALVFLVVGINCRWKLPIAYFLIDSLGAEERANLVKGCLIMLKECNIKVISLTFDGTATNFAMATILGANFNLNMLRTYFIHPTTKEEIFIILDVCHMLKLLRNALAEWNAFLDIDSKLILWQFFKNLVALQEKEELHLATKIRSRHIHYHNEKMKVKLAVQIFSSSVADALEYCEEDLKLPEFNGTAGTVLFCRTVDKMFDLLNTRNSLSKNPYRRPLSERNIDFVTTFFRRTRDYLLNLKNTSGEFMVHGRRKTGFLGLIISMQSVELIVQKYIIEKKYFSYLLSYKLSQDHLETFFAAIRARGGFNNNPTSIQFAAAYKRLLVHAEISSTSASANCIPQDNTHILHVTSTSAKKIEYIDNLDDFTANDDGNVNELCDTDAMSTYQMDVVEYICGFVVKNIKKQIKCHICCAQLEEGSSSSKFLLRKDRGGLIKASCHVIYLCKIAENIFRHNTHFEDNVLMRLICLAKRKMNINNIFPALNEHILDQHPINNHLLQLVNLILKSYFTIRIHHRNMSLNELKDERIKHKFTKLILFKHQ